MIEAGDRQNVRTRAAVRDPAMDDDHSVEIVDAREANAFGAQGRLPPSQRDEVPHEAEIIRHRAVGFEAVPPDEMAGMVSLVVAPELVFEDFLAHEQGRDPGRRG